MVSVGSWMSDRVSEPSRGIARTYRAIKTAGGFDAAAKYRHSLALCGIGRNNTPGIRAFRQRASFNKPSPLRSPLWFAQCSHSRHVRLASATAKCAWPGKV
jgi:hypothetical protein